MNKKSLKINVISSIMLQLVTIVSGFILPRIILVYFGSETNGLVSSINQFLSYVSLLEGGISGVIMAGLYQPLAENNTEKISAVVKATDIFFKKISIIFVLYALGLGIIYPLIVQSGFSWRYVFSLTLILAASIFIQYCFSLTYRALLIADRRGYIVYLSQMCFVIINLIFVLIALKIFPNIHVIKGIAALAYTIQPVVYNWYINKHYRIDKHSSPDQDALEQRWSGFGQNIAYFIHSNTDVVVLTFFTSLSVVSIYSVYAMVIKSLRNLVTSISSAVSPSMGNILTGENMEIKNDAFNMYEFGVGFLTSIAFTIGGCLLVPFVMIYTNGITDVDYYQPYFAIILLISEAIYAYSEPFVNVAFAAGHFKQTAKYAYSESVINILISILVVRKFGLIGVSVGTVIAMGYRMIVQIIYLKKNILFRSPIKTCENILTFLAAVFSSVFVVKWIGFAKPDSYLLWAIQALEISIIVGVIFLLYCVIFRKNELSKLIHRIIR